MDIETVKKAKEGDAAALEEIYNKTRQMVYFTALGIVKNEYDAQDLVQDTYIKAFQSIGRLENEEAFISWLKTIVINISKNYMKKKKPLLFKENKDEDAVIGSVEEVDENFIPPNYVDNAEKRKIIKDMIESLPDSQRMAVMLYYFDELPLSEVSKIMETAEGTTKSRLNYARKQIRAKVEDEEKKGNKLYVGVPMLTKILHLVSKDCNLPAETAKRIFSSSLKAANIAVSSAPSVTAGTQVANKATVADEVASSAESAGAAKTAAASKGIISKIAGIPLKTKVIAIVSAVVILAGAGAGITVAVKQHNEAAKAAIVLQQKAKAKAASEAAAKKKVAAEAAAKEKEEAQRSALMQKLCGKTWHAQQNDSDNIKILYFYPDNKCVIYYNQYKHTNGGLNTIDEGYRGDFKVTGKDKVSVHLTLQCKDLKYSSTDISFVCTVGKGWYTTDAKEKIISESEGNGQTSTSLTPISFTLESGKSPYDSSSKSGDKYYFYCFGDGSPTKALEASQMSDAKYKYPVDFLGASVKDIGDTYGQDYYYPSYHHGGSKIAYLDERIPYGFITPNDGENPAVKIAYLTIPEGYPIDEKFKSGLTYQQLKDVVGDSLKTPSGPPDDNSDYDVYDAPYWDVSVDRDGYTITYQWENKDCTWPAETFVTIDNPGQFDSDNEQTDSEDQGITTDNSDFAKKLTGGWDWEYNGADGGHVAEMSFNADGACSFKYSEKLVPQDDRPMSEARGVSEEYDGTYKPCGF